jgi:hypothetical protein
MMRWSTPVVTTSVVLHGFIAPFMASRVVRRVYASLHGLACPDDQEMQRLNA